VEAFETLFRLFSNKIGDSFDDELPILAVDGSKIQIPTNPDDAIPSCLAQMVRNLTIFYI